jgi:hypothetical protein
MPFSAPRFASVEQQEHMRIEQLEKRLSEVLQREASLNV